MNLSWPCWRHHGASQSAMDVVTVLDVRPRDEFTLGYIPVAVAIPLPDLESRLPLSNLMAHREFGIGGT